MGATVPGLPGLLSASEVARTAAAIARVQRPDGAVPWATSDLHVDAWNHVEAAMAMLVGGEVQAAERAYDWLRRSQRADGSWPMRVTGRRVEDAGGDTNMTAYVAVGVWHHWLVRREEGFVARLWPVVRRALDYVTALQLPFGGIAWCRAWPDGRPGRVSEEALLTGSSSILHSLRAGLALADLLDQPQPEWELAAGRLRHAIRDHAELFADRSTYSMDWYYPVLGGALRGADGRARLEGRWEDFVVAGLGCRCVDTNPWVTAAETCELVLALDTVGRRDAALGLLGDIQRLRHADGLYWTGYVYPDDAFWPVEQTTYSSAAVVLAVDALAQGTPGADIFRGASLPVAEELALECGCVEGRQRDAEPRR